MVVLVPTHRKASWTFASSGLDVVQIVGGHEREVQPLGDLEQLVAELLLDGDAVIHQFAEVVLLAEDVLHVGGRGQSLVEVAGLQPAVHLPRGAPGRPDQAGAVPLHELAVEPGVAVVALDAGQAGQPVQVVQALGVAGPQRHVGVGELALALADLASTLVVTAAEVEGPFLGAALGREVPLDADDRLDAGLGRGVVELEGTVQVAVVGDRDRALPDILGRLEQVLQARSTIEHRVLGVDMEMDEIPAHGFPSQAFGQRRPRNDGASRACGPPALPLGEACNGRDPTTLTPALGADALPMRGAGVSSGQTAGRAASHRLAASGPLTQDSALPGGQRQ